MSSDNSGKAESANIDRIAEISTNIRKALRNSLPTPQEQFMTVMVPGQVVEFDKYKVQEGAILPPLDVQLNQAILCDDMPVMATLQMGPTGRLVARSYAATISKLVSATTPVGINDPGHMTENQKRYNQGMNILSSYVPEMPGVTLIELYTLKQAKYTEAVAAKDKAFNAALDFANKRYPNSQAQANNQYERWVSENAPIFRNLIQSAYMDWVISGKKEEVEYWFAIVNQDTALARVEKSKEAMRWAVVEDSDGSSEYQTVRLEPANWANICEAKMRARTNQTKTADWYTWEIDRLEQTNIMLSALQANPPKATTKENINTRLADAQKDLAEKMTAYLKAEENYQKSLSTGTKGKAAYEAYKTAQKNLQESQAAFNKVNLENLSNESKVEQNKLVDDAVGKKPESDIQSQIDTNKKLIEHYVGQRSDLLKKTNQADSVFADYIAGAGISKSAPAPSATGPDYFTPITVEVASSQDTKSTDSSASSYSAGASGSYGLFTASAAVSYSQAQLHAMEDLTKSSVKVSFECMRVNITRSWLRPELFYDMDLVPGPGVKISPGFGRLNKLINNTAKGSQAEIEKEMDEYSTFSYYPTAFIVACNVVLEISGSTLNLQTYMHSSETSVSASIGYGPFSINGSYNNSSSGAGSSCTTTASGCCIEIKSPQIIGWVSEMVPALPRLSKSQIAAEIASASESSSPKPNDPKPNGPKPSSPKPSDSASVGDGMTM
ncbi:Helicase with zinc finger domain 2 [Rhizoctonia solani]|uniref:Helicase with zinc finger domain 2 n=1 Tax=Rhizoctonia solani TaxID=456999 RepID=A0A0K6FN36_9AGAM|nr:Helicase with zinc finger domain 2 [Rhizoctonia solani]